MIEDDTFGKRSFKRRHLLYYLPVTDTNTGETVGRIGDINEGGILLLTGRPIPPGETIPVAVGIPGHIGIERDSLELTLQVRWCREEARKDLFTAGCMIESIDDEQKKLIPRLIEKLGFSDGNRKIFLKNDENVFTDPDSLK